MKDAIVTHSHEMIRRGSKSFAAAAWLFGPETRRRAYMLYAWCRYCDDQIDGQDAGWTCMPLSREGQLQRLAALRERTCDAFLGRPMSDPVFAAFQCVVRAAQIPQRHAMELLAGLEMDVTGARYQELDDTLLYCYRVAGVVGVMMAHVMGVRDPLTLARAADLGIAFQLTNVARDVIDDAGHGRCYLPGSWLAEAGVPPGGHADVAHRAALSGVVGRLLAEAEHYYWSAGQGLKMLPLRSAWAVATALGVYRGIGIIVRRRGPAAWDRRAVVSRPRKACYGVLGFVRALRAVTLDRWCAGGGSRHERALWRHADVAAEE
jgi:phytoene synthase